MNQTALTTTADTLPHSTAQEHLQITREWAALFGVVFGVVVVLSSVLGALVSLAAPIWLLLPAAAMFTGAVVVALVVLRSLEFSRYCLQERFSEWQRNQEAGRRIAELQAAAVNVSVRGKSNVVQVGTGQAIENTRIIPVRLSGRLVENVAVEDLSYACERLPVIGLSRRSWWGEQLPSGKVINTADAHNQLLQPFIRAGLLVERGPNRAGRLTTLDAGELKAVLGLLPAPEIVEAATSEPHDSTQPVWRMVEPAPDGPMGSSAGR